ncbi:alanine racemase [Proteinivorax tanatarense]|uniref:Alanine racemase n=1 Tax=Proteinivorax tanatarense TaxID=1260629 RepID=A0AAU7VLV5_9FIRM
METPRVIINYKKMEKNFKEIYQKCKTKNIKIRPHYKAHKTPQIAKLQQEWGSSGITVSKVSEGENLVANGFKDILIAYPLIKSEQLERVLKMRYKADVTIIVDSFEGIKVAEKVCQKFDNSLKVLIKVNTGLNRCGIDSKEQGYKLAESVSRKKHLDFLGLISHAGHAYAAKNIDEIQEIAAKEVKKLMLIKSYIEEREIFVKEISVGATPTINFSVGLNGVTEVRPGNFIFYDNTQASLGVTTVDNCSLIVKSTVVSKVGDRAVIDAGSKTLGLDRGAHGNEAITGYGRIVEYPFLNIISLSEEHGVIKGDKLPKIGEEISIIPNHSCVVMNLNKKVYLNTDEKLRKIDNSGKLLNY